MLNTLKGRGESILEQQKSLENNNLATSHHYTNSTTLCKYRNKNIKTKRHPKAYACNAEYTLQFGKDADAHWGFFRSVC